MARPGLTASRKFQRLACALGSQIVARGVLEILWDGCYEALDDRLGTATEIAHRVVWNRREARTHATRTLAGFVSALVESGFLDLEHQPPGEPQYRIHDLWHHAPQYVIRRRARERQWLTKRIELATSAEAPAEPRQGPGRAPARPRQSPGKAPTEPPQSPGRAPARPRQSPRKAPARPRENDDSRVNIGPTHDGDRHLTDVIETWCPPNRTEQEQNKNKNRTTPASVTPTPPKHHDRQPVYTSSVFSVLPWMQREFEGRLEVAGHTTFDLFEWYQAVTLDLVSRGESLGDEGYRYLLGRLYVDAKLPQPLQRGRSRQAKWTNNAFEKLEARDERQRRSREARDQAIDAYLQSLSPDDQVALEEAAEKRLLQGNDGRVGRSDQRARMMRLLVDEQYRGRKIPIKMETM